MISVLFMNVNEMISVTGYGRNVNTFYIAESEH